MISSSDISNTSWSSLGVSTNHSTIIIWNVTVTGSISPLGASLGGKDASTLSVAIPLEAVVPLVARLAVKVSLMGRHGGAMEREGSECFLSQCKILPIKPCVHILLPTCPASCHTVYAAQASLQSSLPIAWTHWPTANDIYGAGEFWNGIAAEQNRVHKDWNQNVRKAESLEEPIVDPLR